MKNIMKGYIAGFLTAAVLAVGVAYAANSVRIVINNKELIPTDAYGNRVEVKLIDGTTYLPIRAVANAFGKAVYWDGPNSTVYLGDMDGILEYPTAKLTDVPDISSYFPYKKASSDELTDNYGNTYASAVKYSLSGEFETLCNMKYSRFKGTLYVKNGYNEDRSKTVTIEADGKIVFSSGEITKTSSPIYIDVDITGCNDFKIITSGALDLFIGDAGFYQ